MIIRLVASVLLIGLLAVAPQSATAAPRYGEAGSVPKTLRHGVEYGPVYRDNVKAGYAMLVHNAGQLVYSQIWGLYDAPFDVMQRADRISPSSADGAAPSNAGGGGPVVTFVSEDSHNVY